ncbi:MAG: hypothetical protein AAF669_06840 [Pseudomonadota bacterium]
MVEEPQLRQGTKRLRPFSSSAKVTHRGTSRALQRVVTDFAADVPYAQVVDKLMEHYGVCVGVSTIRRITMRHGQQMLEKQSIETTWPETQGEARVIAEMDGSMVPIMTPDPQQTDQRKGKRLLWKEAKLCLARTQGQQTLHYGGTIEGGAEEAGAQMFTCAVRAGFGQASQLHAVGDGASWIANQVDEYFGVQGRYLVNFYHVCDYLSAAAKTIQITPAESQTWLESQKARLKAGKVQEVLDTLKSRMEPAGTWDTEAPVHSAYRYLSQRRHQLHYAETIKQDLPGGVLNELSRNDVESFFVLTRRNEES